MHRLPRAAACGLLVVTLLGCGSEGGDAAPTSSTTAPPIETTAPTTTVAPTSSTTPAAPSSTVVPPDVEAEILAAHQGFWDTWLAANDPPNPNHPGLERYYTGAALEQARSAIAENVRHGLVIRLPAGSRSTHTPRLTRAGESTATVRDCEVDDAQVLVASTGVIQDDRIVTNLYDATLVLEEGRWKVLVNSRVRQTDGIQPCESL